MKVSTFCFCRDLAGHFGLVKSYSNGLLTVIFDDGERNVRPNELVFI